MTGAVLFRATRRMTYRVTEDQIRHYAPARYLCGLTETEWTPDANTMVGMLAEDNQALADTMKTLARKFQDNGDDATSDMLIQRIETHEKFAWMLRSTAKAA